MEQSEHGQVLEFLKRHVIGRAVVAEPVNTTTDGGRITAAYEEDAIYSNLVESATGFAFDLITLTRGTRYLAASKGKGLVAEGTLNTVRVLRYEITKRISTHQLIGHSRFISSTNVQPDPFAGVIFLVQMALRGDVLTVRESMVGYADLPAADGSFRPGAVEGTYEFSVAKDRLRVRYEQERFDVDPKTLARKSTGDKFPPQVSEEVTFPERDLVAV